MDCGGCEKRRFGGASPRDPPCPVLRAKAGERAGRAKASPAPRARILSVGVSAVTMDSAIAHIRDWIETGTKNFAAEADEIASKAAFDRKGHLLFLRKA